MTMPTTKVDPMKGVTMLPRSILLALTVLLGAGLASSPTTAIAQQLASCPTGATISVAAPTAAAPSTVNVTVTPALNIKAASAADVASFHLHYFIDTPATAAGIVIPSGDPKIIHSGTTTQDLGALGAGQHTVTVVLGQLSHAACDARGSVTFTLTQAVTATPAAATPAATAAASPA